MLLTTVTIMTAALEYFYRKCFWYKLENKSYTALKLSTMVIYFMVDIFIKTYISIYSLTIRVNQSDFSNKMINKVNRQKDKQR